MQAFSTDWRPPSGVLGKILLETRDRVADLRARAGELEVTSANRPRPSSLAAALQRKDVAIIAEVKRRSPSKGTINAGISATDRSRDFAKGGAAALSILTEAAHFGGSNDDLQAVRAEVELPILRKDFHIDPIQLLEARALGAAAVLLIARALAPVTLAAMAKAATELQLEAVVEIRTEEELDRALALDGAIIGVNCRDLETLRIDSATIERLIPLVPPDRIAIAESGVRDIADVQRAAAAGADAVLVGSSVSGASDATAAVAALVGVPRRGRGRPD